ncbi:hypothetical protein RvY_10682-2 [Ramazzottius varieornatus]|nr:hypothetical protein RvY_10682-2 [Ramazzottius varieornatus]
MAPVPDDVVTEILSGASEKVKPEANETAKTSVAALPAPATAPVPDDAMERDEMNPVPPAGSFGAAKARKTVYIDRFKMQRTRPENMEVKCGTAGRPIKLITNYVRVEVNTTKPEVKDVLQYRVDFTPGTVNTGQKFRLMRLFADKVGLHRNDYIFDRSNILYCGAPGGAKIGTEFIHEVSFEGMEVTIRVVRVATLSHEEPQVLVQMNTQLNRFQEMDLEMKRDRDAFFDPTKAVFIRQGNFEIWPGFETSIGVYDTPLKDQPLLMSIDPKFRIVRKETALQFMTVVLQGGQRAGKTMELIEAEVFKAMKGSVVETSYNHKSYRVEGVRFNVNPASIFEDKKFNKETKEEIVTSQSYADYIKVRYHKTTSNMKQPMLVVKPSNKAMRRRKDAPEILLIPELCQMTGYTDKIKGDFQIMKQVTNVTKMSVTDRMNKINEYIKKLTGHPAVQEQLDAWGTKYHSEMINLPARLLNPQVIVQGGDQFTYQSNNADWLSMTRSKRADKCPREVNHLWMLLHCNDENNAKSFAQQLAQNGRPMGLIMTDAPVKIVNTVNDSPTAFVEAARKHYNPACALVVAILPSNSSDRYNAFKEFFCCTAPCPSQVVVAKTISDQKKVRSVATKVCMQILAKLGGENWKMKFPFSVPTMVIGVDSHRDKTERNTVVAVSATHNAGFSGYFSFTEYAKDDDAVYGTVTRLVKKAVEAFKKRNNVVPVNIFIYRDGISQGQLDYVREEELKGIKTVLGDFATDTKGTLPRLTYILVNKRDSSRFFEAGNNPCSGTVIDKVVTRPFRYDFFIVSQSVREGTVAPTYYDVISDQVKLQPDAMQQMTYMLCHMYFNWPGTIRAPAPCQYARKHAQLVALSIHAKAKEQLEDKLFFL